MMSPIISPDGDNLTTKLTISMVIVSVLLVFTPVGVNFSPYVVIVSVPFVDGIILYVPSGFFSIFARDKSLSLKRNSPSLYVFVL